MDTALVLALYQWVTGQAWLASLVVFIAQYGIFVLPIVMVVLGLQTLAGGSSTAAERGLREAIIAGCVAAVVAFAIGLVLERTLHRPRPFLELGFPPLFPHVDDSSFPSDHTLVGVAFVGPLLWRASRPGSVLVAWALVVGFARVCAGVHYPSDILGSAVLALLLDVVAWRLLVRFRVLRSLRSDAPPPGSPP